MALLLAGCDVTGATTEQSTGFTGDSKYWLGATFAGLPYEPQDERYARYGPCNETDPGSGCDPRLTVSVDLDEPCPKPAQLETKRGVPVLSYADALLVYTGPDVVVINRGDLDATLDSMLRQLRLSSERRLRTLALPKPSRDNRCFGKLR
jgi:hypothetical protein